MGSHFSIVYGLIVKCVGILTKKDFTMPFETCCYILSVLPIYIVGGVNIDTINVKCAKHNDNTIL